MTKEEIKVHFEIALKDWNRNKVRVFFNSRSTDSGFCRYFQWEHLLSTQVIEHYLAPYWEKYRTKPGLWCFRTRKERVNTLKLILEDLNNEK